MFGALWFGALCFIPIIMAGPTDTVYVIGADSAFFPTGQSKTCDFSNSSCQDLLCHMLSNNKTCAPYVIFAPITGYNMNCFTPPTTVRASIIVFGISYVNDTKIISTSHCDNVGECLRTGCKIYNSNTTVNSFLFGGVCSK
jgi:hypothetical protein